MNFRSSVSCASRPIEATVWINEIPRQTSRFLILKLASGLKKITNMKLHRKKNALSWAGKSHGRSMSISRSATQTNPSWTSNEILKVELKSDNLQSFHT